MENQPNNPTPPEEDKPANERPETWQPDQQGGQDGAQPSRTPPQTGQSDQKGPKR